MTIARYSRVSRTILLLITILTLSLPAYAQYGGGTGEPNDPYLIYTAEQMNEIGLYEEDWDKHFRLMNDIDLVTYTGTDFNIIGIGKGNPFTGVFDGNGKKVFNFSYTFTMASYIGLFGYVESPNAEIKNLVLIDPNIYAIGEETVGRTGRVISYGSYVGSLVGSLNQGVVSNCYVQGGSVSSGSYIGGLVGTNGSRDGKATISNCHVTVKVFGTGGIGGLVGLNTANGTIINSSSCSEVLGKRFFIYYRCWWTRRW